jgi:hypothetical protein
MSRSFGEGRQSVRGNATTGKQMPYSISGSEGWMGSPFQPRAAIPADTTKINAAVEGAATNQTNDTTTTANSARRTTPGR